MPWMYRCESCGRDIEADQFGPSPERTCKAAGCHADGCIECIGPDGYCLTEWLCNGEREDNNDGA